MMRRILTFLFTAVLAVPLFAQDDLIDVAIGSAVQERARVPVHTGIAYDVWLTSRGPLAQDAELVLDIPGRVVSLSTGDERITCSPAETRPIVCRIAVASPFELKAIMWVHAVLDTPGTQTATARVGNRTSSHVVEVVDRPSLSVSLFSAGLRVEAGQTFRVESAVSSRGATAVNVRWTYTLPAGGTFLTAIPNDPETQCSVTAQEVVCSRATMPFGTAVQIVLEVRAPEHPNSGSVITHVEVTQDGPDFDFGDNRADSSMAVLRRLVVTNTSDEGGGSLRQALLEAQSSCTNVPCTVAFAIPPTPGSGLLEIRPKLQLPEVRGMVKIDGATQQGARIVINGAEAGPAHGLVLGGGCQIEVLDLTITGFHWPGIQAQRGRPESQCSFGPLHLPTLIARNHISNNYRGVMIVDSGEVAVRDNTITGNRRAGIFVERTFYVEVTGNAITGNGAAGMFLDTGVRGGWNWGGAIVTGNVISGNSEWGITRTNGGEVQISRNSIFGNPHPAIDLNLDFETPNKTSDDFGSIPNKPVVLSAFYDPAREATVVTFRLDSEGGHLYQIDFYANDPAGIAPQWQMQEWVAMEQLPGYSIHREVTVTIPRDLRGRLLVGTTSRGRFTSFAKPPDISSQSHDRYTAFDTSEPSNAVMVQ